MNNTGIICPLCKTDITEGDAVKVCPSCGIPHHQACWENNHGCSTANCPENPTVQTVSTEQGIPSTPTIPFTQTAALSGVV